MTWRGFYEDSAFLKPLTVDDVRFEKYAEGLISPLLRLVTVSKAGGMLSRSANKVYRLDVTLRKGFCAVAESGSGNLRYGFYRIIASGSCEFSRRRLTCARVLPLHTA